MKTKEELLSAISSRLSALDDAERKRLMDMFEDMIADRLEMGMPEADAVAALGDVDALIRDHAPAAMVPVSAPQSSEYREAINEVHIHMKNADAEIVAAPLPGGMTAQITASEANVFTWSFEDGALTVREAGEARRGLFHRSRKVRLTLNGCRPAKLIADSYGGDIGVEGLTIGEMAVLASSSGDVALKSVAVDGRTEVTTRSGDIELEDIRLNGDCKLEATSGDIEIKDADVVSLRLRTASGDVEADGLRADTAALGTTSGDIEMRLRPDPAGYDLRATSDSGDVRLPDVIRSGSKVVTATSASGDIHVRIDD